MDKEEVKEKILRWQLLADEYSKKNISVFIKTLGGDIHFCKIVLVGETKITVDNYAPKQREGERTHLDWLEIIKFEKVKEELNSFGNYNGK